MLTDRGAMMRWLHSLTDGVYTEMTSRQIAVIRP
jgi:hypothetical protein